MLAQEFGDQSGYAITLLQRQKVAGVGQIDDARPPTQTRAQGMPVCRRCHAIVQAMQDQHRRKAAGFPVMIGGGTRGSGLQTGGGGRMSQYFDERRVAARRQINRTQGRIPGVAFKVVACQKPSRRLGLRRGRNLAAGGQQYQAAHLLRPIVRETAGDAVAEGMTDQVRWSRIQSFDDRGDIGSQIVQRKDFLATAAAAGAAQVDVDGAPARCRECIGFRVQITATAAPCREQYHRIAPAPFTAIENGGAAGNPMGAPRRMPSNQGTAASSSSRACTPFSLASLPRR